MNMEFYEHGSLRVWNFRLKDLLRSAEWSESGQLSQRQIWNQYASFLREHHFSAGDGG